MKKVIDIFPLAIFVVLLIVLFSFLSEKDDCRLRKSSFSAICNDCLSGAELNNSRVLNCEAGNSYPSESLVIICFPPIPFT